MGFLTRFVKKGEIRPLLNRLQNNFRTKGKKSTQFLKGTTRDPFVLAHFGNKNVRT